MVLGRNWVDLKDEEFITMNDKSDNLREKIHRGSEL